MDIWNQYKNKIAFQGTTKRERLLNHTAAVQSRELPKSLSYQKVSIDGVPQSVSILDQEEMDIKTICSLPREKLVHGGLVEWADNIWLITSIDAHNEVYAKGEMQQCNFLLKWLDADRNIVERWCIVEDGTKYLIGEQQASMMAIGAARIAVTISKDSETQKLSRGKRFVIDDLDSDEALAFQITKTNKLYNVFNGRGIFRFILNEVNLSPYDNKELFIADYYDSISNLPPSIDNKGGWL